ELEIRHHDDAEESQIQKTAARPSPRAGHARAEDLLRGLRPAGARGRVGHRAADRGGAYRHDPPRQARWKDLDPHLPRQAGDQEAVRQPARDGGGTVKDVRASSRREKSVDELHLRERELAEQLYKLRFQRATGRMESPARMRQVRREIARIKTLLNEKARA